MASDQQDLGDFDENHDDRAKILDDHKAVPCRICEHVFGRLRLTWIFCIDCNQGICDGEHGRQVPHSRITKCIRHFP